MIFNQARKNFMKHSNKPMVLIYGKKELILEFLEIFNMDRQHDELPLSAVLLKGDMKKELKKWVWKGD